MIIPVRCFSCGKVIASSWEEYQEIIKSGKKAKEALDEIKFKKYCCRSAMMSHVESIDVVGRY